jgi:hypothetical protein
MRVLSEILADIHHLLAHRTAKLDKLVSDAASSKLDQDRQNLVRIPLSRYINHFTPSLLLLCLS